MLATIKKKKKKSSRILVLVVKVFYYGSIKKSTCISEFWLWKNEFYRNIFQIKKEQKLQSYVGGLRGRLIEYIELFPCMHKNQKDDKLRHD